MAVFTDQFVKRLTQALITNEARAQFGIGLIKPRFSKTTNSKYISNGCNSCDALLGDFFLIHEELALLDDREQDEMLVTILSTRIPNDLAKQLNYDEWDDEDEIDLR